MQLLTITLAEYRLDRGSYPKSLDVLSKSILQDAFSGSDVHYRTQDSGFTLWSVGLNQKDDDAKGDDMVLTTEQPASSPLKNTHFQRCDQATGFPFRNYHVRGPMGGKAFVGAWEALEQAPEP